MLYFILFCFVFFFSSRRRHTRYPLVTGVQTCALPIPVSQTLPNASATIAVGAVRLQITPPTGSALMTSIPTVAPGTIAGQQVQIVNTSTDDAIGFQDQVLLPGSKLK